MNKIKVIALFGKSGVGKDTIQKYLINNMSDIHKIIGCTTRPKRDYEIEGIDYNFLKLEDFLYELKEKNIIEYTEFRNWMYGTQLKAFDKDKINIGIFNPASIEKILTDNRFDVLPIQIITSNKIRLLRSLNREENPDCKEICRRFLSDEKDFESINFPYIVYDNTKNQIELDNSILDFFGQ